MNRFLLTFLSIVYFTFLHCQTWTQLIDFPGGPRDDGTSFTIGNKAYCFTGLEPGQCTVNGYIFDGGSETWSPMGSLPIGKERQYATGFSYNGIGYMLGGLTCSGVCLNDFWQYSTSTNSWTPLPDFPGSGRQGMINFVIKDKVYIIGGRPASNIAVNEVWEYNFTTTTWTQKNNLPISGMWRGAAFAIDTVGYICYGLNNSLPEAYNHNMYRYDYMNDVWSVLPNLNLPLRRYVACAIVSKKAFLYGGHDTLNVITNDVKLFNPTDTSITTYSGLPTKGRRGAMFFSLNDVFYITAGLDTAYNRIKETWKNDAFVGLRENNDQLNAKVYPNPANDKLSIVLNVQSNVIIKLYNQLGELVFYVNTTDLHVEINASLFSSGVYFLSLQSQEGVSSKKVIINH